MVFEKYYMRELTNPAHATPMVEYCSRDIYAVGVVASGPVVYCHVHYRWWGGGSFEGGFGVSLYDLVPEGIGPHG